MALCIRPVKQFKADLSLSSVSQVGKEGHCSVEDARAALDLYKLVEEQWEQKVTGMDRTTSQPDSHVSLSHYMLDQYWPEHMDCSQWAGWVLSAHFTVSEQAHAHRVSALLRLPSERDVKDDWCCSLCVNVISCLATSAHLALIRIPVLSIHHFE